MKHTSLLITLSATVLSTGYLSAQTNLEGSPQFYGLNGGETGWLEARDMPFNDSSGGVTGASFSFTTASDSVFAVTLYGFQANSNVLTPSITLDPGGLNIGLDLLESAQSTNNGDLQAFVFAANIGSVPAGSLNFDVDWDTSANDYSARGGMVAYQISGATMAGAVTAGTGVKDTALVLPGVAAGSFAIDMLVDGSTTISGSPYGSPAGTTGFVASSNRGLVAGYYTNAAGEVTIGWDGQAAQVSIAAALAPVPEPSTYALASALMVLGAVVLRRRLR